jgi:mono/diheme cytochrome c family protein
VAGGRDAARAGVAARFRLRYGRRMARRRGLLACAVTLASLPLALLAGSRPAGGASTEAGVPARGAAVFQARQCWSCHALDAAGSTGKSGPDLDRWLGPHAAQLEVPAEELAARRIAYGGTGMTAYARDLTPEELADLVAFVVGRPVSIAVGGLSPLRPAPAPPPETNASPRTIPRWVARKRLRGAAARGAAVFGREGCLSCHRYLGAGRARFGGPNLTNGGPTKRTTAATVAYLRSPAQHANPLMPGYADLGPRNLRALAEFLAASRRPS